MKKTVIKFLVVVYVAMVFILLIFIATGIPLVDSVYDLYNSSSINGKPVSKSLDFLISYTQSTGDLSLMESAGFTREQAQQVAMGDLTPIEQAIVEQAPSSDVAQYTVPTLSGSLSDQITTLSSDPKFGSYYRNVLKIDSHGYYYENQSSTYNTTYFGSTSNTVGQFGCPLYAMCLIKTYLYGQIYTTIDMARDIGVNVNNWSNTNGIVYGSWQRQRISVTRPWDELGLSATSLNPNNIPNPLPDGYYMVYGYNNIGARTGNHFRALLVENGNYIILPNIKNASATPISHSDLLNLYSCGGAASSNNGNVPPSPGRSIQRVVRR